MHDTTFTTMGKHFKLVYYELKRETKISEK